MTPVEGYDWRRGDLLWKPNGPIYRVVRAEGDNIKVGGRYVNFWTTITAAVNSGYSRVRVKR